MGRRNIAQVADTALSTNLTQPNLLTYLLKWRLTIILTFNVKRYNGNNYNTIVMFLIFI